MTKRDKRQNRQRKRRRKRDLLKDGIAEEYFLYERLRGMAPKKRFTAEVYQEGGKGKGAKRSIS